MTGVKGYESLSLKAAQSGSTIDLLGNPGIDKSACGFSLLEAGGGRSWYNDADTSVTDIFTLRCSGSNISQQEQQLRYMLDLSHSQHRGVGRESVYLRGRTAHDNAALQTLVLGGALKEDVPAFNYPGAKAGVDRFMLSIQHMPAWERVSGGASGIVRSNIAPNATPTRLFYLATDSLPGDLPARIYEFRLERSPSGSDVKEFWIGWKSNRDNDDYDAAVHFWDCKDSTFSNNTTDGSSASATSSCAAIWTPAGGADNALLRRLTVSAESALGTSDAQKAMGEYRVLLRARATGTATFYVRVSPGNVTSGNYSSGTRFKIDSAFFKLHSIGRLQIPLGDGQKLRQLTFARQTGFAIDAQIATSGTGNLEIDGFYLIPSGEGFAYMSTPDDVVLAGSSEGRLAIYNEDNGRIYGELFQAVSGPDNYSPNFNVQTEGWGVPQGLRQAGNVAMVMVYQDADRHRLGDLMDVTIGWTARYSRLG